MDGVAVGFFRHGTEILLVRESASDRWSGVTATARGTAETDVDRLRSEIGRTDGVTFVRSGEQITPPDDAGSPIEPYLFECETRDSVVPESVPEHEWIQPPAIFEHRHRPGLWRAYLSVAPTLRTVRNDTDHGASFVSLRALEVLRDQAIAAAMADNGYESVAATARELRECRPEMKVIGTRIDRVMSDADRTAISVRDRATAACADAVQADRDAAERVAPLLGDRVLTLSRSETVRSALETARPETVFVAESRPAREGITTAERLAASGLDTTVLVDAAIEGLVAGGAVDTVLAGADTVLADGSAVNKIGTRTAMRAGRNAGIDRYIVCSRDKIVPEDDFAPDTSANSDTSTTVYDGDATIDVHNPTFERVPPTDISAIVTEAGVHAPDNIEPIASRHASFREWIK